MQLLPGQSALVAPGVTASSARPRQRPSILSKLSIGRGPRSEERTRGFSAYVASVLGGLVLAVAWLVPESGLSAWLGGTAALLLAYAVRVRRAYLPLYCAGLVGHLVGFHWVYQTVRVFGGFGPPAAGLVFALFVVTGALQFLLFAVIHHHLDPAFDSLALRSATAVALSELLMPRLFPWHFGHTEIAFTPFVQIAGLGGAIAVSFLMFWLAEAAVRFVVFRERRKAFILPVAVFGLAMAYGTVMMGTFRSIRGEVQEVVLVQGNATLAEKRDLASAQQNLVRIFDLSSAAAHPDTLVVWPEGSVPAYIPATIGTVGYPPVLPWIGNGSAFLVGSYSFLPNEERFNAAFAVYPDGDVPMPYFKRALIPFGEYMPMASYFKALKELNAKAGVFSAGIDPMVFTYPMHRPDGSAYTMKVSPLICYEDTVPSLARESVGQGAELLVNITSDSWFGRTLAPHQHHLIAAFRAIENRRYLIRATNTGLSAVVDPLGKTIARIPPFSEGTATAQVRLLNYRSAYTQWFGDRPWWSLLALSIGVVVVRRWQAANTAAS
ncbi:MAG: apolipoprotein N-acyltransferase [Isosphaeraceae bacterium]